MAESVFQPVEEILREHLLIVAEIIDNHVPLDGLVKQLKILVNGHKRKVLALSCCPVMRRKGSPQ